MGELTNPILRRIKEIHDEALSALEMMVDAAREYADGEMTLEMLEERMDMAEALLKRQRGGE